MRVQAHDTGVIFFILSALCHLSSLLLPRPGPPHLLTNHFLSKLPGFRPCQSTPGPCEPLHPGNTEDGRVCACIQLCSGSLHPRVRSLLDQAPQSKVEAIVTELHLMAGSSQLVLYSFVYSQRATLEISYFNHFLLLEHLICLQSQLPHISRQTLSYGEAAAELVSHAYIPITLGACFCLALTMFHSSTPCIIWF